MKKSSIALATVVLLLFTFQTALSEKKASIEVIVNGRPITAYDADGALLEPITENGLIYLPTELVQKCIGLPMQWEPVEKRVIFGNFESDSKGVWLGNLPVFNTQYKDRDNVYTNELTIWSPQKDLGADGKLYPNGFMLNPRGDGSSCNSFKVEFLLDGEYANFQTKYLLTEGTKSTSSVCILKVIGDGIELYKSEEIMGGFVPQDINVDVTGILKLTFEVTGANDGRVRDFRIVLADPRLLK